MSRLLSVLVLAVMFPALGSAQVLKQPVFYADLLGYGGFVLPSYGEKYGAMYNPAGLCRHGAYPGYVLDWSAKRGG